MKKKINLGILFGGRSCEHEISVISIKTMLQAVSTDRYNVLLIGIDKQGHWQYSQNIDKLVHQGQVIPYHESSAEVIGMMLATHYKDNHHLIPHYKSNNSQQIDLPKLDVIFPMLHGPYGEDGCIQGLFEMAGIPYVGCGVASSALAMDKALAKQVLKAAGIPQTPYIAVSQHEWDNHADHILEDVQKKIGQSIFVKPANMGSSIGVNQATNKQQLISAIEEALQFDTKIVIEKTVENAREFECGILGNENPQASVLGEVIPPKKEFYNYHAKYFDERLQLVLPAELDEKTTKSIQTMAIDSFKAINGRGLARVDFFLDNTNEIILNEINTLPGFTPTSMYPKLWEASNLSLSCLIDKLVELAFQQHQSKSSLKPAF